MLATPHSSALPRPPAGLGWGCLARGASLHCPRQSCLWGSSPGASEPGCSLQLCPAADMMKDVIREYDEHFPEIIERATYTLEKVGRAWEQLRDFRALAGSACRSPGHTVVMLLLEGPVASAPAGLPRMAGKHVPLPGCLSLLLSQCLPAS